MADLIYIYSELTKKVIQPLTHSQLHTEGLILNQRKSKIKQGAEPKKIINWNLKALGKSFYW